jgi:hypothetical protein
MDFDQLVQCGCALAETNGDFSMPSSSNASRGPVTRVAILNLLCPLRGRGIAKVVVINGVASEIVY